MQNSTIRSALLASSLLFASATAQTSVIAFSRGQLLDFGATISRSELVDLNGDGDPDLLASLIPPRLVVHFGARGAAFAEPARTLRLPSAADALQGHLYVQAVILGVGVQTTRAFDLELRY